MGKVGDALTIEQGAAAARLVGLAMLGSLQRELGELDRITAWLRVLGMVNTAPATPQLAGVINGFSNLIVEVFGPEIGKHSRSAVGMAELPFGVPVEIEAEVEIGNNKNFLNSFDGLGYTRPSFFFPEYIPWYRPIPSYNFALFRSVMNSN